jgi:hypothetical protein
VEGGAITRGRRQIVLMLGTVVIFFFACLLPFKVLTMWIVISPTEVSGVLLMKPQQISAFFRNSLMASVQKLTIVFKGLLKNL